MSDRIPLPVVTGLLAGRAGDEWVAARLGSAATVVRVHLVLDAAPGAGESVTVEIRDQAAGGGSALSVTISGTDRSATATGSLGTASAGELWMRLASVTAGAAAMNLSGWAEVEGADASSITALTTVERLKEYLGAEGAASADRLPIAPVTGLLDGRAGDEWRVAELGSTARVVRAHLTLDVSPGAGESVTAEVRTASGGGGSYLDATFGAGETDATATGAIATNDSGEVWLRLASVTAGTAAMNLSGWIEVETGTSEHDTLMQRVILGVSGAIQARLGRRILQETVTQRLSAPGGLEHLTLPGPPASDGGSLAVVIGRVGASETTTLAKDEDFALEEEAATLWHLTGTWPKGTRHIKVTWDRGYAEVPEALRLAATKQAAYEWRSTYAGGDRLGKQGQILGSGDASYVVSAWAPGVLEMIAPYREIV